MIVNIYVDISDSNRTGPTYRYYCFLFLNQLNCLGGALGYFLGGYVPPGTPNWHPILEKISPKTDTPFALLTPLTTPTF